jgi:hypothetical protein
VGRTGWAWLISGFFGPPPDPPFSRWTLLNALDARGRRMENSSSSRRGFLALKDCPDTLVSDFMNLGTSPSLF